MINEKNKNINNYSYIFNILMIKIISSQLTDCISVIAYSAELGKPTLF